MITGEYPPMPGGIGDFTRVLATRLQAQGQDVHLLSRVGSHSDDLPLSHVAGWGWRGMAAVRAWTKRLQPDVVNLQFQTGAFDMSPLVHFLPAAIDAPLVTTFHDLRFPYLFPKAGLLRDWIVRRLARTSAGVVTTNQEDEASLRDLPLRRVIPIGSGLVAGSVAPCARQRLREQLGAGDDSFVLGHFGFINALKGLDCLLDAIACLRQRSPDLRLVLIGGSRQGGSADSDYQRQLEARVQRLGLGEALLWTGYLPDDDVAAWHSAVDLIALPFVDGASYRRSSLMAAIDLGCAILTTQPAVDVPAFRHGCNIWLTPPKSSQALAWAIEALMRNRDKLDKLRLGASQLRAQFDWDAIARDTADFYQEVVDSRA